ncbi:hypothetical protein [Methylobacterium nigriterrae]|uniref:hypothetical protein n=1 Tax=Methylobacterium nigriterrae TaxID=3127512 RepID=UPI0030133F3A
MERQGGFIGKYVTFPPAEIVAMQKQYPALRDIPAELAEIDPGMRNKPMAQVHSRLRARNSEAVAARARESDDCPF